MRVNGIIAEYNPFHNGHKYHLEESRRLTGADYTVVVMSGSFVQRGAPALLDKRLRAETALRCGADLVLELPVLYAVSSAEFFAAGAVALLDRLGIVTHLCFGSECGDTGALERIAQIFSEEPEEYRNVLRHSLKQGASYPKARLQALSAMKFPDLPQNCEEILSSPNNILGIEYIRALRRRGSTVCPVTVQRTVEYHNDSLPEGSGAIPEDASATHAEGQKLALAAENTEGSFRGEKTLCSATAIRRALCKRMSGESVQPDFPARYMPPEAMELLRPYLQHTQPLHPAEERLLFPDDFSSLLYYKLVMESGSGYEKYLDVSSGLSDRIGNLLPAFTDFDAFCNKLKTKDMTYTRISRCLLHILLGITKEDMELGKALDCVPYARVLGFRKSAAPLLGAIKRHSDIPLVTSVPDARKSLSAEADRLLTLDILAGRIYREVALAGTGQAACNEISAPPVIL